LFKDSADNNRLNSGGNSIVAISDLTQPLSGGESLSRRFGMPEKPILPLRLLAAQQTDGGQSGYGWFCLYHNLNVVMPHRPVNMKSRTGLPWLISSMPGRILPRRFWLR
jgi:hypothetical protein